MQTNLWPLLAAFSLAACIRSTAATPSTSLESGKHHSHMTPPPAPINCGDFDFTRDWASYPATIEINDAPGALYVLGDVHGDYDHVVKLLQDAKLIRPGSGDQKKNGGDYIWTGGSATLVQLGDLINKGSQSLKVMDLFMDLMDQAAAAGGRLIILAGNHEMAFLADPGAKKLDPLKSEISDAGLDLCQDVYSPDSDYGEFLRERPAAAYIDGIYMSHSGFAMASQRPEIVQKYTEAVDSGVFQTDYTCGNDVVAEAYGFFNADVWWGDEGNELRTQLKNLGVRQVLFGHDPNAFQAPGVTTGYFGTDMQALIKMDVGMWKGDSYGAVYRCAAWLDGGGCGSPERLQIPAGVTSEPVFEPLPVQAGAPPYQSDHAPRNGC